MSEPLDLPCHVFVEMVTDYLEGVLTAEEIGAVDAHLALCPHCVTVLDQWREVVRLAGQVHEDDVHELEDEVRGDLMAAFRRARAGGV